MKSLILDSATKNLYCALIIDNEVVFEEYISGTNEHAKRVVDVVDKACKKANIKVLDLDEVICGIGPGSYTGVRMAVTVCKMLASLSNIKMKTVSTLLLMSSGIEGVCKASIDARRGNSFTGFYKNGEKLADEGLYPNDYEPFKCDSYVNEASFKVDPIIVLNKAIEVKNPFLAVPNYLRDTEAERNLKHD